MRAFPTILIVAILYNLLAFSSSAMGHPDMQAMLGQGFNVTMFSGGVWRITGGDLFVLLSLGALFAETIKAARGKDRTFLNHAFSMLVFCAALVEFIVLKGFSTSAFFFIVAISLLDVVAGYTITIVASRRDETATPMAEDHYN